MAFFHQTSVLMPDPAQPGRARVWGEALGVRMQVKARHRVRSRRGVGIVIALVKKMLRDFGDVWRMMARAHWGVNYEA